MHWAFVRTDLRCLLQCLLVLASTEQKGFLWTVLQLVAGSKSIGCIFQPEEKRCCLILWYLCLNNLECWNWLCEPSQGTAYWFLLSCVSPIPKHWIRYLVELVEGIPMMRLGRSHVPSYSVYTKWWHIWNVHLKDTRCLSCLIQGAITES